VLRSEALKGRSELTSGGVRRSVLKCAQWVGARPHCALPKHEEGAGGSGKERHHHDHPQQAQHEHRVPKIRWWLTRDCPGSLA
jgi:hypothetical protein